MLEAVYNNWMQDTIKRKWLLTYLPLMLSVALIIFLAWTIAKLFWFFKAEPNNTLTSNPVIELSTSTPVQYNLNNIKNANLFGALKPSNDLPMEETIDAPETTLNLTLNGTVFSTVENESLAIISKDNDNKVYRIGDELQSNVSVAEIYPEQVIINNRGKKEVLSLPKETDSGTPKRSQNRRSSASANKIAQQLKQNLGSNPAKLTDIIRVKKGKLSSGIEGFRIYAGKERQMFNQLGLKPGDFVTAVNGMPLSGKNSFEVFKTLQSAPYINLSIERNGQPTEVSFDLARTK